MVKTPTIPLISLIIGIIFAINARLALKTLMQRLLTVNVFILIIWLFLPFSYNSGGETLLFKIGGFNIYKETLLYTLTITIKTNALVILTITILGTSELFSLAHAMVHLKIPVKLVYLFFFSYRYITLLHEEHTRMKKAVRIRCFKAKTNIHTYKTYAYLVGVLIIKSCDRAERIYKAMLCRGFNNKFPIAVHFYLKPSDYIFLISAYLSVLCCSVLYLKGYLLTNLF
ncbi:cobalt ABC transporter, inner membrane subunit CbiQ [Candidatus Magnetoovum chiemensis]|nr:cobalt ABC transporter, inner membrane subunit CbiQ [Candidatus Magnetoovum chiemensis]